MSNIKSGETVFRQAAKQLSSRFGREVTIRSANSVGGGCINRASKLSTNIGSFFFKWNGSCAADMFLREAEGLEALKQAAGGTVVVPEVYASKMVDDTPGFLVLEYLEPANSTIQSDEDLGRGLARIHQFTQQHFGFSHNNYCGATPQNNTKSTSWTAFFRDKRLRYLLGLIQQNRPLPGPEVRLYEKLLDRLPEWIPDTPQPALIHGDLWSGNYMHTARGPALIDPAAYFADREMEFAIMTLFGGFTPRFYAAYNEVYPLPPDWKERNPLYQLYHILNHYYLFGGGYRQQALQIVQYHV